MWKNGTLRLKCKKIALTSLLNPIVQHSNILQHSESLRSMRHVITLLVENEFGVLARIAGLFSGRGFNIESLCVAETLDPTVSTMTLVTRGDDQIIEQVLKQLNKADPGHQGGGPHRKGFCRKGDDSGQGVATAETREEILRVVEIFRGKVVDVGVENLHHRGDGG